MSAAAVPGPALITVRGTLSSGVIRTASLLLNVISDFTLIVTPATSAAAPVGTLQGGTLQVGLQVVPISGFAGTVAVDFPDLPAGFTATGGNVASGATAAFALQNNLQPAPTVFPITIRGRFGPDVQTVLLCVHVNLTPPLQPRPHPAPPLPSPVYAVQPP